MTRTDDPSVTPRTESSPQAEPHTVPNADASAHGSKATPTSGRRPHARRRSPARRVLAALSTTTALIAVAAAVAAASMIPPIGARRDARVAAERELRALLAPDETIVASTFASQRRWTDMFRESFGLVAATTSRILYVGAPPTPLLRPREDGPMELLVESYPYEASFVIQPRDVFFGRLRGLALKTPLAQVDFLISPSEWRSAQAVAQAAVASQRKIAVEAANTERATRTALTQSDVYVPYVVKRGETLIGLARRFRTSPDVLRQLNQLKSDEIKAGQRIRVPDVPIAPPDSQ